MDLNSNTNKPLSSQSPRLKMEGSMGEQLSGWLIRISTGWVALAAVVGFLLFAALVLPNQAAQLEAKTGEVASPDVLLFYSPEELYQLAEAYGAEGREAYIRARFTFDVVWPLVYAVFLSTAISWVYGKAFEAGSPWRRMNLVPVLGALFDYLENVSTSLVMWRYPEWTAVVDLLAPIFTLVKWVFVGGGFGLLLIGVMVGVWRWKKRMPSAMEHRA